MHLKIASNDVYFVYIDPRENFSRQLADYFADWRTLESWSPSQSGTAGHPARETIRNPFAIRYL